MEYKAFLDIVDCATEDIESARHYMDVRGVEEHLIVAEYLQNYKAGKVSYREVATALRYDKRIRRILYKYIGYLEERIRAYISNRYSDKTNSLSLTDMIQKKLKKKSLYESLSEISFGQLMVASEGEEMNNEQKVLHAVHDLYRQLGIVMLIDLEKVKSHKLKDVCCVGMHVCTQVHGISNKARFMPIFVSVDLCTGTTRVQCDAFENNNVNYRQACLEMAKLFWNEELEYICKNAQFSPAKQKLIEMKNRYSDVDSGAVILVHSDGNTRPLWNGISDKTIGSYSSVGEYMPAEIDAGSNKTPYMMSLNGTGIRIIRVRDNSEVPDYYTSQREDDNYSSATGVFKYGDVFWAISPKPYDPKYNRSLKESRFDHPYADYAEKDMIEMYPIQLQSGDNPDTWAKLISDLCTLSIQYEQSTILPLPLHLAKNLAEYLLEI